ncbi:MAG: hypothetical protein ACRD0K_23840 [Egibacteraceae bacterium]
MKRITVTVDDELLDVARADVAAGRAASLSAWVADAMRRKARAWAEFVAELEDMEAENPYSWDTVEWVAQALGQSPEWVADGLGVSAGLRERKAG